MVSDDVVLNLARTIIYFGDASDTIVALNGMVADVARASEDLERVVSIVDSAFARKEFSHARKPVDRCTVVVTERGRCPICEGASGLCPGSDFGEHVIDGLEFQSVFVTLLVLVSIVNRGIKCSLAHANSLGSDVYPG